MKKRFISLILCLLLPCLLALPLPGLGETDKLPITSLDRLSQPGIIIATGISSPTDTLLVRDYPNAQVIPYTDIFLAYMDVAKGRVDACVSARREMEFAIARGVTGVRLLDENYVPNRVAVGVSPVSSIPSLLERLNAFIAEKKSDGTLDDMYNRWVIQEDDTMPAIPEAEHPAFTLRVGTTGTVMPYSYFAGSELTGYDIELARRFAVWLGARLELQIYDFGGIIAAAESGRIDCIMSNLFYSEEKAQIIPFSDFLSEVEMTAMVRDDGQSGDGAASPGGESDPRSFLGGIRSGIEKTFIREGRWRLFVQGMGTTLAIALPSILLGTLLGFLLVLLCRRGNPLFNGIVRVSAWLVHGTPMVVLLMILYYILFASAAFSGSVVSVIGFSLTLGLSVFRLLRMGIEAVDGGQHEAALALGFSDTGSFLRLILPQAIPHMIPAYRGELIQLLKATSVVGYIAVQDLTKMGDLIRSRTYDAFFPLIAVTVIYFLLEGLIRILLKWLARCFSPKDRKAKDILKGIRLSGQK